MKRFMDGKSVFRAFERCIGPKHLMNTQQTETGLKPTVFRQDKDTLLPLLGYLGSQNGDFHPTNNGFILSNVYFRKLL